MNINLDNYEQYLLMYVDNELSAAERRRVEEFLGDYPYLKEELEILQQTVLPLEPVSFDKSSLLKTVLDDSMQEKLLMHLDGELPAGESLALQNSISADKGLQKEWAQLQKTKLDAAEVIMHPDKESLYRKERARIVTGRFVRWAVAAMLIGAGFYGGISLLNENKTTGTEMAGKVPSGIEIKTNPSAAEQNNTGIAGTNNDPVAQPGEEKATNPVAEEVQPLKNNLAAVKDNKAGKQPAVTAPVPTSNPAADNRNMAANEKPVHSVSPAEPKELPQRSNENVLRANEIAAVEKPRSSNTIDLQTNITTTSKPNLADRDLGMERNGFARTAALGLDETNNQDQILMMEEENVSRSKAAIFLKKLKRNVERRTNIKPGKSLRIAGFEFAVK